jgi:hypothetical protein
MLSNAVAAITTTVRAVRRPLVVCVAAKSITTAAGISSTSMSRSLTPSLASR